MRIRSHRSRRAASPARGPRLGLGRGRACYLPIVLPLLAAGLPGLLVSPARSGVSPDIPTTAGASADSAAGPTQAAARPRPRLLWNRDTGRGIIASPAVGEGVLVVATSDGRVVACEATEGTVLWRRKPGGVLRQTPAIGDGRAFVATPWPEGRLWALDLRTGATLWRAATGDSPCAPLAVAGLVIAGTRDSSLSAWDATTGEVAWERPLPGAPWASLALADSLLYVATTGDCLLALRVADGTVRGRVGLGSAAAGGPAAGPGAVVLLTAKGEAIGRDPFSLVPLWTHPMTPTPYATPWVEGAMVLLSAGDRALRALRASDGAPLWEIPLKGVSTSRPAPLGEYIVATSLAGEVLLCRRATGEVLWRETLSQAIPTSPAVGGGRFYVPLEGGEIRAYAID